MRATKLTVLSNKQLNPVTYELMLAGDNLTAQSGQFIEVAVQDCYLKRPFSVADFYDGKLVVLYKTVGVGTKAMTLWRAGDTTDALVQLGNGFDTSCATKPLLIGGGIGIAPLYLLAKEFAAKGIRPKAVLAFRTKDEAYYLDEFAAVCDVVVTTDDGSLGNRGYAIDTLKPNNIDYDYYYACGPMPMLKGLAQYSPNGQISLEARMGCGFGACMGCSIMTTSGAKRVCKEGPVFFASEVIF